jgi:isopentenyl diphosphate isomerase/L-lactate dehydrogenase-like FMN-dependent dehydrogenase
MNYSNIVVNARKVIGPYCQVCPVCNGRACKGQIPGPGGKETGIGFIRNFQAFGKYSLNIDTLYESEKKDCSIELFGKTFSYPFFAAPIGGVQMHYSDLYDDDTYSKEVLQGCHDAGIAAFTGDGINDKLFEMPLEIIRELDGYGIPTIKPWNNNEMIRKIKLAEKANAMAVAMDVDAAGLSILADKGKPVSPKSQSDLKSIISSTDLPVIIKGIMTVTGAAKALEAGAYGIVVSNHGGRVLDDVSATLDVLPEISRLFKGKLRIFIDGGVRTGADIFKALALGADAVLIGRPFVTAAYGGGHEGVRVYSDKIGKELESAMMMTGANRLDEINSEKIRKL